MQESAPDPKKAALQAERRRKAGERLRDLNKKRRLEKVGPREDWCALCVCDGGLPSTTSNQ